MARYRMVDGGEEERRAVKKQPQRRAQPIQAAEPREEAARLGQALGNRLAGQIYARGRGAYRMVQRQPASPNAQDERTPAAIAGRRITGGPGKHIKDWQQAARLLASAKKPAQSPTQRVNLEAQASYAGLKLVDHGQFENEFKQGGKAGKARAETGLPEAFLAVQSVISPLAAATPTARDVDTNLLLDTRETKGGGEVWVSQANLTWIVQSAAFLDISRIDPAMLGPTRQHEQGHREIAEKLQAELVKRMQAELEQSLPSEKNPLKLTGQRWMQEGVNAILRQAQQVIDRYLDWWDELAEKSDADWDAQEAKTLSKIAAARIKGHQAAEPVVPEGE